MSHLPRIVDENLHRVEQLLEERSPYAETEIVSVTFPSSANADHVIAHTLQVANPENIHYEVVQQNQAAIVYDNQGAGRLPWGTGYIVLRCDTADAVMTLRLSIPR